MPDNKKYDEFGILIKGGGVSVAEPSSQEVDEFGIPLKKKDLKQPSLEPSAGAEESVSESISPTEYKYSFDEIKPSKAELKPAPTLQVTITPPPTETTKGVNEKEKISDILKEAFVDNSEIYDFQNGEDRRNDLYKKMFPVLKKAGYDINDWADLKAEGDKMFNSAKTLRIANEQLKRNPDNEDWQYAAAVGESELGRYTDARDRYEKIIAKNPQMASAYTGLAYVYGNTGQTPMALSIMDDAIENNPDKGELYHNRAIYKQRVEDYPGALKDLEQGAIIAGKTKDKALLTNIYEQRTKIWGKLSENKTLAQQYIDIINGEGDPATEEIDQEYFKEQYKKDFNNARRLKISTKKDEQTAKEKLFEERTKAITEGESVEFTEGEQPPTIASANIKDWQHATAFSEAIDDLLFNPQKAGVAGLIMNPVAYIARAGIEGVTEGGKEIAKGFEKGDPIKVLKGSMEAGIAGIMAVTPVGWGFTGASAGLQELPYGEDVEHLLFAPISKAVEAMGYEPGDLSTIGDIAFVGLLMGGAHKAMNKIGKHEKSAFVPEGAFVKRGKEWENLKTKATVSDPALIEKLETNAKERIVDVAEKLSDKLQNKEPITPDEIKLYEFVSEQLSKGELQNVIDKAGLRKLTKAEEAKPTEAAKPFTEVKGLIPFTELADISKKEKAGTELTAEEVKLKETYPDEYKAETERKSKGVPSEPAADKNYNIAQEVNKKIAEEHPSVSVLITPKGEDLSMTGLFVKETERGKGAGSKVLETVKSEADRTGKKVTLTATDEFGGDIKRLNEFYERNGFTKVGENKFEYNPKQPTPKPTEAPKAEVKPAEVPVGEKVVPKKRELLAENIEARNEPITNVPEGSKGETKFTADVSVPITYKLIESESLQPSHLPSGERNPKHHIAGAQPKERSDVASKLAQDKIAKNPNFEEVSGSPNAYFGTPIINERGEVIQGNNRSIGLKKHYENKGNQYKADLIANAEKYGLTKEQVEGMKNPILVREVKVTDSEAVSLGQHDVKDIETGGKQHIDPISTSRKMTPEDKSKLSSILFSGEYATAKEAIRASANKIKAIIKGYLNPAQIKNAFSEEGFTAKGMDDIQGMVTHFLFEDGKAVLPELFESLPDNIQKGLQKSMPNILAVEKKSSLLPEIQNAIIAIAEFKNQGLGKFNEWSNTVDMFKGATPKDVFTEFELTLAKKLLDAKNQAEIKRIFAEYEQSIKGKEATLLEEKIEGISKAEAIQKQFDVKYETTIPERHPSPAPKTGELGTVPREKPLAKEKPAEEVKPPAEPAPKVEAKPLTETEQSFKVLEDARAAFRKKMGLGMGAPLQAIPEFIAVVKAAIKAGYLTAKDFIRDFRDDFVKYKDEEIEAAFNEVKGKEKEILVEAKDKIKEQKEALRKAEAISVPAKPSEIKAAVKEITKPEQKKITITEKEALKKQLRDIAKGAKIGAREGKKTEKERVSDIQSFQKEAIDFIDKSEILDKGQKDALKLRAKNIKTFPALEKYFDYADKVIEDAGYANRITDIRKLQSTAAKRKHPSFDKAVKDFLNINPENIPNNLLDKYTKALDEIGGRVPDYKTMQEIYYDIEQAKIKPDTYSNIKTYEKAVEKYNDIALNKVQSIEDYRKLFKDINSFKRKVNELHERGDITEQEFNDLIEQVGKDQKAVESKYASEITSLKTDLINELKGSIKSIGLDNITAENKKLLDRFENLDNNDLRNLSPEELYNLRSILDNAIEDGYVDAFRLNPIIAKAEAITESKAVISQIDKAKPFKQNVKDVVAKLGTLTSSFWEGSMGLGKVVYGAFQKSIVAPVQRAAGGYIGFVNKGQDNFIKLKKKYGIKSDQMNRIGMVAMYLREYALQHNPKYKGKKDRRGNKLGTRDWFKHILESEYERTKLSKDELKSIQNAWDLIRKKDSVSPNDVYNSFVNGTTEFLSKNEMEFLKDVKKWKDENMTGKQRFANEVRGMPFEELLFHIKRIRKGGKEAQGAMPFEMTDKGNVKLAAGSGKQVLTEEMGVVETNFEKIFTETLEENARDYYFTPMLQKVNAVIKNTKENLPENKKAYMDVAAQNLQHSLNNEFVSSKISPVVRNLMKAKAAQILIAPIRTVVELVSSVLAYPARAKAMNSYIELFKPRKAVRKLLEDTESSLTNRKNLNKHIELEKGTIQPKGFIEKSTHYLAALPELLGLEPVWMATFKNRFKEQTGVSFSESEYLSNTQYKNRFNKQILDAASTADATYEKIAGSTTGTGQIRTTKILPSKISKAMGLGEGLDAKKSSGAIMSFMTGYTQREILQAYDSFSAFRQAAKDAEYSKGDVAKTLLPVMGTLLGLTAYNYGQQISYALTQMLIGDDDDKEKAKEELEKLTTANGVFTEMGVGIVALGASKYRGMGRQLLKLAGSVYYNYADTPEDKAYAKSIVRNITYSNPFSIKESGYMGKEKIALEIGDAIAPIATIIDNFNKEISSVGGAKYLYEKVKNGEILTEPEKEAVLLMQLSVNTFNAIAMWGGKAIPNTFVNKIARGYTKGEIDEIKKAISAQKKEKGLLNQKAEKIFNEIKDLPKSQQELSILIYKSKDRALYDKLLEDIDAPEKLEYKDRLIKQLGIENEARAKYISNKTQDMDAAEKFQYIKDLKKKKIITKEVEKQINKLKFQK